MTVESFGAMYIIFKGNRYLKLTSGNLLPEEWEDLHYWFGSAIAPKEWREALARTAPMSFSNVDRVKEMMTQF
jgi:hypothetical protein